MINSAPPSSQQSSVYYLPRLRLSELAATKSDTRLITVDLEGAISSAQALQRLGQALDLPSWYGANLDALFDCLSDPEWLPGKRVMLYIQGTRHFRQTMANAFANLIETFSGITEARNTAKLSSLSIVIDAPARGITEFPKK